MQNPSTLRLYVAHGRPLGSLEEENELRGLFEREGRVTVFSTQRGRWRNSLVSFESTDVAIKAKNALHGTAFHGETLRVSFVKPTRRVLVRGLPRNTAASELEKAYEGIQRVEVDGQGFAIVFDTISDAKNCVAKGQLVNGVLPSFDFVNDNERRTQERRRSPERRSRAQERRGSSTRNRSRSRSRSPPKRARSTSPMWNRWNRPSRSSSEERELRVVLPKAEAQKAIAAERPKLRESSSSSSSSSSSNSSLDTKKAKKKAKKSKKSKKQRKRDQSGEEPERQSENAIKRKKQREEKLEEQLEEQREERREERREGPLEERREEQHEERREEQHEEVQHEEEDSANAPGGDIDPNVGCRRCLRLLGELKTHVDDDHADNDAAVQKAVIRAWFESHFSRGNAGPGETAEAVSRKTLLLEVNTFLATMGWPTWKTSSTMYKDWFLREGVMNLSDDDIRKGRNWSLFRKDGFAPGGEGDNAQNKEQRFAEMTAKLRQYMGI